MSPHQRELRDVFCFDLVILVGVGVKRSCVQDN